MLHSFDQLAPEYQTDWSTARVKPSRQREALETGERLLKDLSTYKAAEALFGVPALWLMATNERESSGNLHTYLGNGDPLNERTRDVPRGRGPFSSWQAGAKDALTLDGIVLVKTWNPARACYEWELWNGWGYRAHGVRSPYLVGGTTLQQPGKYIRDGVWDPHAEDTQLGCVAVAWGVLQQNSSLAFTGLPIAQGEEPEVVTPASPPPITVGGSHHDTSWLQAALNQVAKTHPKMEGAVARLGGPPSLQVDGNFGRRSRIFVRAFEEIEGLNVDRGFVGPQVLSALDRVLGAGWTP